MKVLHISPTYFDQEIGGGERYPWELTKALAKYANVSLVVFGSKRETEKVSDNLTIEVYPSFRLLVFNNINPLSISFARQVRSADIIHCHQFRTVVSNISILFAKLWRRPVCVTDYGGGGWNFAPFLGLGHLVDCFLLISEFSTQSFWRFGKKREIIYGGVDISKFHPQPIEREKKVLFVGRIMPHKGIDYLVKAIQDLDCRLRVVGVPSNSQYLELLKSIDRTNKVDFAFCISDSNLVKEYCSSLVTVLPSVYVDCYGGKHPAPELLGLTLIESMACGTSVICTNVGGMPEVVQENETGFVVPPNDAASLRERIKYLLDNAGAVEQMGQRARQQVEQNFTWDAVAQRVLRAYKDVLSARNV